MRERIVDPTVERLLKLGLNKWQIAAAFNPEPKRAWNKVHAWCKAWYQPLPHHKKILEKLLADVEARNNAVKESDIKIYQTQGTKKYS